MRKSNTDSDAFGYVLGTFDLSGRDAVRERAAGDPLLRAALEAWEGRLAPLAVAGAVAGSAAPPDHIAGAALARIDAASMAIPGTVTRRASEGRWFEIDATSRFRILTRDPAARRQTIYVHLDPGGVFVEHPHEGDEEIFMLTGDLVIGALALSAGDYHFAPAGRDHPLAVSQGGCTCIIRMSC